MTRDRRGTRQATHAARGAALGFVLLVIGLLAALGFALADLCVVQLNLSRRYLQASKAQLLAQAAVEQFRVVYDQACERARMEGLALDRPDPIELGLDALYASADGLPDGSFADTQGCVRITFDHTEAWHSTDNSLGEYPCAGWLDRGLSRRSVPPFSVELLVQVTVDDTVRRYRAVVSRRWPYAVFAPRGHVVLCGSPRLDATAPSSVLGATVVEGAVGTLGAPGTASASGWISVKPATQALITSSPYSPSGAGAPLRDHRARLLAVAGIEPKCEAYVDAAVNVGPRLRYTPVTGADPFLDEGRVVRSERLQPAPDQPEIEIREGTFGLNGGVPDTLLDSGRMQAVDPSAPLVEADETDNAIIGDVHLRPGEAVHTWPGNVVRGHAVENGFPAGLDTARNPAAEMLLPQRLEEYRVLAPPPLPDTLRQTIGLPPTGSDAGRVGESDNSLERFGLLCGTLSLDPDQPDAPPLRFGGHNRFLYLGSLGNRFLKELPPARPQANPLPADGRFRLVETSGALKLRNCVLYVRGNLDLAGSVRGGHAAGIEGTNATLIVSGTLSLSGGHLDARDQGLVIVADDIVLRAHGDYRGLIIARNTLTVLADESGAGRSLHIRGGVICGNRDQGSLVLRSVRVVYDPVYMKAAHAWGGAVCTAWREIR